MRSSTTAPSTPAFAAICLTGASRPRMMICTPVFSSPSTSLSSFSTAGIALTYAVPPPATMPSSTAARVAFSASSMRSFISFISTSVAAPTLITAPASLARRSCNFSRSKSEVVFSIALRMVATRALIASESPAPSTMVVVSLLTLT